MSPAPPLGLIAGSGRFPFQVAQEARRLGRRVVALGLRGWVDSALAQSVDVYEEVSVGELGKLINRFRENGVEQAVMAGKVTKSVLFDGSVAFDLESVSVVGKLKDFSVNSLLGAIGKRLSEKGITLLDSSAFLADALCPAGVLTRRAPSPEEQEDIRFGFALARAMATWDVGQTVIIRNRVVIAVEALEGTDSAIRRAAQLAGDKLVVVKTASPKQDRRFDLPVIGPDTLATLRACNVACLAAEAHSTLILDKDAVLKLADEVGICVVGVEPGPEADSVA